MKKNYLKITGTLNFIGDLVHIPRKGNDLYKRVLTITTPDNQKLFPELRNNRLSLIDDLSVGDYVEIEFSFEGSEKNDKRYNNIFIFNIKEAM